MVHEEFHFRWLVFKALALSEVVHLRLTSVLPKKAIEEIENIQQNFLWNCSSPKIK